MKYIITESKLKQVIIKYLDKLYGNNKTESKLGKAAISYLNEMYGDLEEYRPDEYPGHILYVKDEKAYMEHDLTNNDLWVDYITIWEDLTNIFSFESHEIKRIIKKWVEETYKLKGVKPNYMNHTSIDWWKNL